MDRARWSSTRWLVSLRPRALRVSAADQPLMSRRAITSRWRTGSSAIASSRTRRVSSALRRSSGESHSTGGRAQWPGLESRSRLEAVGVDGRLVATLLPPAPQERERQHAPLALAAGARLVEQDAGDPGPQRGAALEAVDPVQDREPGVLDDLLGDRPAGHVHQRQPHQERAVLVDQRPERVLVAPSQAGEQPLVVRLAASIRRGRRRSRLPAPPSAAILSRSAARPATCQHRSTGTRLPPWASGSSSRTFASPTRIAARARLRATPSSSSTASEGRRTRGGRSSPPARSAATGRSPTTSAGRVAARGRPAPTRSSCGPRTWSGCSTRLEVERATLVGHSVGCMIAEHAAVRLGERVRGLVADRRGASLASRGGPGVRGAGQARAGGANGRDRPGGRPDGPQRAVPAAGPGAARPLL